MAERKKTSAAEEETKKEQAPPSEERKRMPKELTREQLEALRNKLQKKFH